MPDIKLLINLIALMSKLIVLFPDVADVSKLSTELLLLFLLLCESKVNFKFGPCTWSLTVIS